ncbi:universal stress protein [Oceanidesulfovibrio marinus]|uniref:Universal stress protein n=1 Tax=Oceanidesulfovibrio marinus TaxID=370038 RepID=A0A6P1ZDY6_9BACT|nr:universal stress protein [Oceanidesulfovibrio marinus]QJT10382.1 universal stress protein [Oceanidesulfovibrio marinus]TVM32330.1 universal stress protein [Oceanidesulfovibrio marinus]
MEPKTILWPTDLSKSSIDSAKHVLSLSRKYGAGVVMLYVAVNLCDFFPAYGNYPSPNVLKDFQSWELQHAREQMEHVCERDLKECPNLEIEVVQGDPVEEILEMVKKKDADMIVVAGRNKKTGAAKGTYLAEAMGDLIHLAPVPVLVVNPDTPPV